MKIKNLFKMNFEEEIEAVIKVGDYSEKSATEEIKNYIVTETIASEIQDFINYYQDNVKETGIWLSGFYGSGKSYLAKIISYLLDNPSLMGVEARELFKSRLKGLNNRAFLENDIEGLSKYTTKIVSFDFSGESITGTFYKMLLFNFLNSIGLPKNVIGYTEFQLMKTNKYKEFLKIADKISKEKTGSPWKKSRNIKSHATLIMRKTWEKIDTELNVTEMINNMNNFIENIDIDQLIEELDFYLSKTEYNRIVFIVDEVSEALNNDHIELSELRGAAQHFSKDEKKRFWFIATAQEKLDNILSKKNISKNEINTITDRFQHKIHLDSTEVNKVVKERVLAKTDEGKVELRKFYKKNEGLINSLSSLSGTLDTNIKSEEEFVDYYPFMNYQMRLLKNFLYAVFQQAQSGGSERGMLVTIDKLLKKESVFKEEIGKFVTGYQLYDYGFPMPQSELEEKFNQAKKDLEEDSQHIDGAKILKTIFFLEKSENLKRTTDNITKLYNDELRYIGEIKEDFNKSLESLSEKNYLLKENEEYKITSDIEENMMEEMNQIEDNWENRVEIVREKIKKLSFITKFSTNRLDNKTYNIAIRDEKENLLSSKKGEVTLVVYNILNLDEDIERELDNFKNKYIELDEALLVPAPKYKNRIDKLARSIFKHNQMINRYRGNTDKEKEKVINSFTTIVNNQEAELENLIEDSYNNSWLIYDFNEQKLDKNSLDSEIDDIESKMIEKTFSKRLKESLDQGVAEKFLKVDSKKLVKYCNSGQFNFFDSDGTFIGNELRVVQEIDKECRSKDGRIGSGLVDKFKSKPFGWEIEDIMGALAALMRSGNLKVKYEANDYRIYNDPKVQRVFSNTNEFRSAKFYTIIGGGISPAKKHKVVDLLLEIDIKNTVQANYNQNDFEVIDKIRKLASSYVSKFSKLENRMNNNLIESDRTDVKLLEDFASKNIVDSNLEEVADDFINNIDQFRTAVKYINNLGYFIDKNYLDYKNKSKFINDVEQQIDQNSNKELVAKIKELINQFYLVEEKGVIENYDNLVEKFNDIRQKFNQLFKIHFDELQEAAEKLLEASKAKQKEIKDVSIEANRDFYTQLNKYIESNHRLLEKEFNLSETEAKDKATNSTLKEIKKDTELKGYNIQEVEAYVPALPTPEPTGVGNDEPAPEPKIYELNLKARTNNVQHIKRQLQKVINELEQENYDEINIRLIN